MITIKFGLVEPELIGRDDLITFKEIILQDLLYKSPAFRKCNSVETLTTSSQLIIKFNGATLKDGETTNQVVRHISERLDKTNIRDYIYINSCSYINFEGDCIISKANFTYEYSNNMLLLQKYINLGLLDEESIPEKYLCQITKQIIDTPIYLHGNKEVSYDKKTFLPYLYSQAITKNPHTNVEVIPHQDIQTNIELKLEIHSYVKSTLKKCMQKKYELISAIVKQYTNENISQESLAKSFRCASAADNIEHLRILENKISSINLQDNNPKKQFTALHWAVKRNSLKAAEFLLGLNVNVDIKDASGKSPLDLVIENGSTEMRSLFSENLRFINRGQLVENSNSFRI